MKQLILSLLFCLGQTPEEATLTGKVTDTANHQPIEGALIRYCCESAEAITDAQGAYSLKVKVESDSPGRFIVSKPGYAGIDSYSPDVEPIPLKPGDSKTRNFELRPGARISGHIVDRDSGQPLAGFVVMAHEQAALRRSSRPSGLDGSFALIGDLAPGDYVLEINPPGEGKIENGKAKPDMPGYGRCWYPGLPRQEMAATITLAPGEARDIEIRLQKRELHHIAGVIQVPERTENTSVKVIVMSEQGALIVDGHNLRPGPFHLQNLEEGTYMISARNDAGAVLTQTVELTDRNLDDLKLILSSPVSIQAVVTMLEDKAEPPKGMLFLAAPKVPGDFVFEPSATLQSEGLPPGKYWPVLITPPGFAVISVSYQERPVAYGTIDIETQESTVHFVVTSRPASVSGTVRDGNQNPVPGATVVLLPEGITDLHNSTLRRLTTRSDANGAFHIGDLAPGRYRSANGEKVELDFGQTANLNLNLK